MKQFNRNILRFLAVASLLCVGILGYVGLPTSNEELSEKYIKPTTIKASYGANTFVSVWNTEMEGETGNNQIKLPLEESGMYNFEVAWGDGINNTINSWNQEEITHIYASSGNYTVEISGILQGWRFAGSGDCLKLIEINQWGILNFGNSNGYFQGCENLVLFANDAPDLTGTTTLERTFYRCLNLGVTGNMNDWDVSQVSSMREMFFTGEWDLPTNFNQPINLWNVSSVTDMNMMFGWATDFNQPIEVWNVSSVIDMGSLFTHAWSFNQPIGIWDVSSVTNMGGTFHWATSFNLPLDTWDVSQVTNMGGMFYDAYSFKQNINNWNVSKVTNMYEMFHGISVFNQPIGDWNVSSVTSMSGMFERASSFNQPLDNWDVSSVTDMSSMFYWATAFDQPLNNWNVSKVSNMGRMFGGASLFNGALSNWDVSSVTNMWDMFIDTDSFNQDIRNWDVSNVIDMWAIFARAKAFNQPIGSWNVSKVTSMQYMFQGASSFNQNISNWDVSKVTEMGSMFNDASVFDQDISNWDVSSVTTMDIMFEGATLSNSNYDALLLGWSQLSLHPNVLFNAGNSKYHEYIAGNARKILTDSYGWTISDGGSIPALEASFSLLSATVPVGNRVVFTDTTTGGTSPYIYLWDFGNGLTSTLQNPANTYGEIGTYNVSLIVTEQDGESDNYHLIVTVVADTFLDASFTVSSSTITLGDAITFADTTTGGSLPFNYEWDFGDGTSSTTQNPTYTYSEAGTYSVTLTITDADGVADTYTLRITVKQENNADGPFDQISGFPFGSIIFSFMLMAGILLFRSRKILKL